MRPITEWVCPILEIILRGKTLWNLKVIATANHIFPLRQLESSNKPYPGFKNGINLKNASSSVFLHLLKIERYKNSDNIVKRAWKKEEIYSGDNLAFAPDIIFETDESWVLYGNKHVFCYRLRRNRRCNNGHALNGIIIAYGPDITSGFKIDGAKIWNIAPTILHMYGVPIPEGLDGKILRKIFNKEMGEKTVTP